MDNIKGVGLLQIYITMICNLNNTNDFIVVLKMIEYTMIIFAGLFFLNVMKQLFVETQLMDIPP